MSYRVKLLSKEPIAEDTMAFHFEKPAGFVYQAGQSGDWTLLNSQVSDKRGNKRAFSLASAPFEGSLMIAIRMRPSAFKRDLAEMNVGDEINLEGPFGELTLHDNASRPAVFLAGGIGVTPFRSIVRQTLHEKKAYKLTLFYSNRRPDTVAFSKELRWLASQYPNFHLVATVDESGSSAWDGELGFIDQAMLKLHLPDLQSPVYYVAGPVAMVVAMNKLLLSLKVDSKSIRTEVFTGY